MDLFKSIFSSGEPVKEEGDENAAETTPEVVEETEDTKQVDEPEQEEHLARMNKEIWGLWEQAGHETLRLRGQQYIEDGVKQEAGAPLFKLVKAELFSTEVFRDFVGAHPSNYMAAYRAEHKDEDAKKVGIIVNMLVPGEPCYQLALYFVRAPLPASPANSQNKQETKKKKLKQESEEDSESSESEAYDYENTSGFDALLAEFVAADDARKTELFKFIPNCLAGGFVVTQTVGNRPVILGNKLDTKYMFHDAINSIEISVDISSSVVAKGILSVCKSALDLLDIELNFLLQGHDTKTLPERLIGGVRVTQVDLAACVDTALSRAAPVEVVAVSDAGEDSGDESSSSNSNTSSSSNTSGSDSDRGS